MSDFRVHVWLMRSVGYKLLVLLVYTGEVPPHALHCCLKITIGLLFWHTMSVGEERHSLVSRIDKLFFFFFNCSTALCISLRNKGPFLDSSLLARALVKRGLHLATSEQHIHKKIEIEVLTGFHISQYLLQPSKPHSKFIYEAVAFQAYSIMLSELSAVSTWGSPSVLYLTNTVLVYLLILLQINVFHL